MDKNKTEFLEKTLLGREIDFNDEERIIDRCIVLAYKDMLELHIYRLFRPRY